MINFPACEGIPETLIKHKLFPSTPIRPHIAFTFEILDLYTELLLQAHVPYLSFCRVLETLHSNHSNQKINKVSYIFDLTFNIFNII